MLAVRVDSFTNRLVHFLESGHLFLGLDDLLLHGGLDEAVGLFRRCSDVTAEQKIVVILGIRNPRLNSASRREMSHGRKTALCD
jgi:hypothetical protein